MPEAETHNEPREGGLDAEQSLSYCNIITVKKFLGVELSFILTGSLIENTGEAAGAVSPFLYHQLKQL